MLNLLRHSALFIAITLIPLATRAQSGLDTVERIYLGPLGGSCTVQGRYGLEWATLHWGCDSTLRLPLGKSDLPQFFSLDTASRTLDINYSVSVSHYDDRVLIGTEGLQVTFQPIPYNDSGGIIRASGRFPAHYEFEAYRQVSRAVYQCTDSGTIMDSVQFETWFVPSAIVRNTHSVGQDRDLVIRYSTLDNAAEFFFTPVASDERIEIFNMIGEQVRELPVHGDDNEARLSFEGIPEGDYVARLGRSAVKFFVK